MIFCLVRCQKIPAASLAERLLAEPTANRTERLLSELLLPSFYQGSSVSSSLLFERSMAIIES